MTKFLRAATILFLITVPTQSFAKISINVDPIAALVGLIDASIDFQLGNNLTAGAGIISWNSSLLGSSFTASGFSVRANYLFSGAYRDSWYISPTYKSFSIKATDSITGATGSTNSGGAGAFVGYWWFWNTFQLNLGAGVLASSSSQITYSNGTTDTLPSFTSGGLEFLIGWHF